LPNAHIGWLQECEEENAEHHCELKHSSAGSKLSLCSQASGAKCSFEQAARSPQILEHPGINCLSSFALTQCLVRKYERILQARHAQEETLPEVTAQITKELKLSLGFHMLRDAWDPHGLA
jgi:hypothetical protein